MTLTEFLFRFDRLNSASRPEAFLALPPNPDLGRFWSCLSAFGDSDDTIQACLLLHTVGTPSLEPSHFLVGEILCIVTLLRIRLRFRADTFDIPVCTYCLSRAHPPQRCLSPFHS